MRGNEHRGGRTLAALVLVALAVAAGAPARASAGQGVDPRRGAAVRAGLLLNFLRFTEWPARAFPDDRSPVVVAVAGDDALAADLEVLVRGERVGASQRPVVVRRILPPDAGAGAAVPATSLPACHALFLGAARAAECAWWLAQVAAQPVLTVGDAPEFAREGGMLGLVVRDGRMTFEANPERIQPAGISVSSKLLRLARTVGAPSP